MVLSSGKEEVKTANEGSTGRKIPTGQDKKKLTPACFKCGCTEHLMDTCPFVSDHYKGILRARRQENLNK